MTSCSAMTCDWFCLKQTFPQGLELPRPCPVHREDRNLDKLSSLDEQKRNDFFFVWHRKIGQLEGGDRGVFALREVKQSIVVLKKEPWIQREKEREAIAGEQ